MMLGAIWQRCRFHFMRNECPEFDHSRMDRDDLETVVRPTE